jgi:hypothetical protein
MTQNTAERAEFDRMRAAFEREMIDNHLYTPADFRDFGLQSDGSFIDDDLNDAVAIWDAAWQAARRAPAADPQGFDSSIDELAQEIRRVDGAHSLGAGALAEALMPFITARRAPAAPVPKGWKITEEMHVAAVKVLHRASGVDGLPQRMLDAMLAAAPQPPGARKPLSEEQARKMVWKIDSAWFRSDQVSEDDAVELIRAVEAAHGITQEPA